MIRIQKGPAPLDLVRLGEEHTRTLCAAYEADPQAFNDGLKKMPIRTSIYTLDSVKSDLEATHHGKCCYCETFIPKPYAFAHVEHWRPKSSCRQTHGSNKIKPGYYWLAYSWDNLFLSCAFCNSTKKGDLFPLEDNAARARHHGMNIHAEEPSILKPDGPEDPGGHIAFHFEVPVGLSKIGRKTIEVLGLDSPAHEPRLSHFKNVWNTWEMCRSLSKSSDDKARMYAERSRDILLKASQPTQPYSAMVVAFLANHPLPEFAD